MLSSQIRLLGDKSLHLLTNSRQNTVRFSRCFYFLKPNERLREVTTLNNFDYPCDELLSCGFIAVLGGRLLKRPGNTLGEDTTHIVFGSFGQCLLIGFTSTRE